MEMKESSSRTEIPQIPRYPPKRRQVIPHLTIFVLQGLAVVVRRLSLPEPGQEIEQLPLLRSRGSPDGLEDGPESVPKKVSEGGRSWASRSCSVISAILLLLLLLLMLSILLLRQVVEPLHGRLDRIVRRCGGGAGTREGFQQLLDRGRAHLGQFLLRGRFRFLAAVVIRGSVCDGPISWFNRGTAIAKRG